MSVIKQEVPHNYLQEVKNIKRLLFYKNLSIKKFKGRSPQIGIDTNMTYLFYIDEEFQIRYSSYVNNCASN